MFGPFRASQILFRQFVGNRAPMSSGQKKRLRKRLRYEDLVLDLIVKSGVDFPELREALAKPREEELDPISKYYYATKKNIYGYRPLSWKGHWIKTPHPREIITPTIYHYKPNIKQDQKHLEHIEGNRRVDRRFRDKGSKKIKFD